MGKPLSGLIVRFLKVRMTGYFAPQMILKSFISIVFMAIWLVCTAVTEPLTSRDQKLLNQRLMDGEKAFLNDADSEEIKDSQNLADAAETLLAAVRETHYQHRTQVDQAEGVYDMDCSGFVDYLLKRFAPAQFALIPVESGHARPRAKIFFQLFDGLRENPVPGWSAVDRLTDVRRGDIIAWELATATEAPGDTGHVIIAAGQPVRKRENIYSLEVYDSSGIRHDNDSRPPGTSGIGKGTINFKIDPTGKAIAFQFNSAAHFHEEPIAIGRK
jgi:hypothetical protein